jgi:hypothetical protein
MDQNPLPRGSLQIRVRTGEEPRVVLELTEAAVAVEAQYPAHPAVAMIVINVLRAGTATDGAAALLGSQHLVEFGLTDAITPPEVVLPRPAVQPVP